MSATLKSALPQQDATSCCSWDRPVPNQPPCSLCCQPINIRWERPEQKTPEELHKQMVSHLEEHSTQLFNSFDAVLKARSEQIKNHHTVAIYTSLKEASDIVQKNPPDLSYERERAVHEMISAMEKADPTGNGKNKKA